MMKVRIKVSDLKDMKSVKYHDNLPEELIDRIKKLYPFAKVVLGEDKTLEYWIEGFMFDAHPITQIVTWEWMAVEYKKAIDGKNLTEKNKKEILKDILKRSTEKAPIVIGSEIPSA